MSKLALLIGAKPRVERMGPAVLFEKGTYIARLENVQDSVIMLCSSSRGAIERLIEGATFQLESEDHWAQVTIVGKEQRINVSLERVN